MMCDLHEFNPDHGQRCGRLAGHIPPCIEYDLICDNCTFSGLHSIHECAIRVEMQWFRLAFGGWGSCNPTDRYKKILMNHRGSATTKIGGKAVC